MIRNVTKNTVIAQHVILADTMFLRVKGLLGKAKMEENSALVIRPCQSIHMMFMRFPIDVIFIDQVNQVVGLCPHIPPFAFSPIFFKSACAIELPAGTIQQTQTSLRDIVEIS